MRHLAPSPAVSVSLCLVLAMACATNPATGRRQIMLVSEAQEVEMGRQADREVATSIGLYPEA
jgi:hypothetical protein